MVLFYCALDPDYRLIFSSFKREVRNVIRHLFPTSDWEIDGAGSVLSEQKPDHLFRAGVIS